MMKRDMSADLRLPAGFRYLLLGQSVSAVGDQLAMTAVPLLVLALTPDPRWLGLILSALAIPRLVFLLAGGALSDRYSQKSLMLISDAVRAMVLVAAAALAMVNWLMPGTLALLMALFGTAEGLFLPAFQSITPRIVAPSLLVPANANLQVGMQLSVVLGPSLAALILLKGSPADALLLDAGSFLFATLMLLPVRLSPKLASGLREEPLTRSIAAGWAYVQSSPELRALLLMNAGIMFGYVGALSIGLPTLLSTVLRAPDTWLAIAWGAAGVGGIAGALIGTRFLPTAGRGRALCLLSLLQGGIVAGLSIVSHIGVLVVLMVAFGAATALSMVLYSTIIQTRVTPALQGRVNSFSSLGTYGTQAVTFTLFSLIAAGVGARLTLVLGGICMALAALAALTGRGMSGLDQFPADGG